MASRSPTALQQHVISYVDKNKGELLPFAKSINCKLSWQDLDDLVAEGYLIALEILASGDIGTLESLFWDRLGRSVWDSYDYIMDFDHLEVCEEDHVDVAGEYRSPHRVPPVFAPDPFEKIKREDTLESLALNLFDFLSPTEARVLCLVLGLTLRGGHTVVETAKILCMTRRAVRVHFDRILVKIRGATRHITPQGKMILHRGDPPGRKTQNMWIVHNKGTNCNSRRLT